MYQNRKLTFPFLTLLAFALFMTPAMAQGPRGGMGMGPDDDGPPLRMLDRLDLSAEQQEQVKALKEANREQVQAQREAIREAHQNLRTLMQGDASESDLRAAHNKVRELMQAQSDARFEQMLQIRSILTPDQRKEIGRFRDNRGTRGRGQGKRSGRSF